MIIAVDFDGVVVAQDRPYEDTTTPLRFMSGAREGLRALARVGHVLLLFSARANRALLEDPMLDPLVRRGARKLHRAQWEAERPVHEARLYQMRAFVARELPGVFAAMDDGQQGKPAADLFLDDRALRYGAGPGGHGWAEITQMLGAAGPEKRRRDDDQGGEAQGSGGVCYRKPKDAQSPRRI